MKVAVVTDSNSGITPAEAKELGVFVLPMPFIIGEETLFEDIDLTKEEFYQSLEEGSHISTSQPSLESVINLWEEVLKDYDQLVHIPMSSGLSGSCQTAMMLAQDYDGKVEVVNNQRISVTQRESVLDARKLVQRGMDAKQVREILEREKFESSIYLTLDTLKYLKKGGRITPAAAALGTLLRIKPVLTIQGEKLDAFSKARTWKQARSTMISAITKDLESRFQDPAANKIQLAVAHTRNLDAALEFKKELEELFPETREILVADMPLSISCHVGPGILGIACMKSID